MTLISGSELNVPSKECEFLLREKTGRLYCMFTCAVAKHTKKSSGIPDLSCCPHILEIDNPCPLLETARTLETYYVSHTKSGYAPGEMLK